MKWQHLLTVLAGLMVTAVFLSMLFGIVLPLVWRLHFGEAPPRNTLDVSFVLTSVLAVVALLASAFGGGVYYILSRRIQDQAREAAELRARRALAVSLNNQGFYYWEQYERTRDDLRADHFLLDIAIEITSDAYDDYAKRLDEQDTYYEKVICGIKNNLAYYLAEKQSQGLSVSAVKRQQACECADYVEKRLTRYPKSADKWSETVLFVRQHFSRIVYVE